MLFIERRLYVKIFEKFRVWNLFPLSEETSYEILTEQSSYVEHLVCTQVKLFFY